MAVRILRAKAGSAGKDFWVQPYLINNLRNGLIVAEALLTPEGLSPFITLGCPLDLVLSSFDERSSTVLIRGVNMAAAGRGQTCQSSVAGGLAGLAKGNENNHNM